MWNSIFYENANDAKIDCEGLYYAESVNVCNNIYFATVMHNIWLKHIL